MLGLDTRQLAHTTQREHNRRPHRRSANSVRAASDGQANQQGALARVDVGLTEIGGDGS